ncbi:alpha/beta hydrolase family protein [Serinibacter arcticus]|uniref:Putative lipase/esterase n=1 Tax=Serinibacter arcticus TaxID=1655435 RepID=A0A4Z1DY14_9MICO|nr:alpha/beta hydrolase [Serinibacter arcticus]TGO03930.1 putative lipase/esterase [Serinibacter arcticus]
MDRRTALTLLTAAGTLGVLGVAGLAACAPPSNAPADPADPESELEMTTIPYGDDPSQYAELTRPAGGSKGVVVVIHGGFWQAQYDASLGRPLAASLAANGWTAWNLEYRRVGNGGGYPATFDDVAAGIDALADVEGLDLGTVVTLGHSAGGHLAVWAAGRGSLTGSDWADPAVPVTAAVSQAGVLDIAAALADDLGGGAARSLLGEGSDDRDVLADPTAQLPLDVPVRCIHGRSDTIVPPSQSSDYVRLATAAGADVELLEVDGDHFVVIDPSSEVWAQTLEVLDALV